MTTRFSLIVKNIFLFTLCIWFAVACSSNSATTAGGTGAAVIKINWNGKDRATLQKNTAKAPAGVAVVRIIVNGDGMADVQQDFEAAIGSGTVNGIPAGSGRTVKAQGLDPNGIVIYEGAISNINIEAGKVTDVGTIIMQIVNAAPHADAGRPQSVLTGSVVTLDGSGSSDPNRDVLTYSWAFTMRPNGSGAVLSSTVAPNPTFTPDVAGPYVLELVVNDGKIDSAAASVTITASAPDANAAPVANAGKAQSVLTGSVVTLDGSASSDANGDLLTYSWAFTSRPSGSGATLSNPAVVNPTFTPDVAGAYVVGLIVNDGKVDSAAASVTITASARDANAAPVANAGAAQTVMVGTLVTLDGSNSSDANGDPLTFSWAFTSRPSGSGATLSNPAVVNPTLTPDVAGAYVINLVVNDGKASSAQVPVTITAYAPDANAAPVANAGTAQSVTTGSIVTLDGSGSSDANGDPLTYSWAFTSKPGGSGAALSNPAAAKPTFIPDVAGSYVFNLVVNDGKLDSAAATVIVTAQVSNAAPLASAGTNQTVIVGAVVTLDGSGSSDPDGDPLTYHWAITSRPAGSNANLSSASAAKPSFNADAVGTFDFSLTVNDGKTDSTVSTVRVSSIANNGTVLITW